MSAEAEFAEEVRMFLETAAVLRDEEVKRVWGQGPDSHALFEDIDFDEERAALQRSKDWRAARYDAGLGWLSGPPDLGGRGLPESYERIWSDAEAAHQVPDQSFFAISLGMVAPAVLAHATSDESRDLVPKLYRGDLIGCQMFSEPGAGSDLAGVQMRADRHDDGWVLNGQKVWTSGAHYCDVGEVLARSEPGSSRHAGLTAFIVDLDSPGIEIRPLRQMTGGAHFNEVFFREVRVSDRRRLGEPGDGWRVAMTTLMSERASIGGGGNGWRAPTTEDLAATCRHFGLAGDPLLRQRLARIYSDDLILRVFNERADARAAAGSPPGPEMSLSKLLLTRQMKATAAFVSAVLGPRLVADTSEWGTYSWSGYVLGEPAMHIAGGTDEILRTVVGERVLGLPKEPRPRA